MTPREALITFAVVVFLAALAVLFWAPIPAANEQLIGYMLGQLSGFISAIIARRSGER